MDIDETSTQIRERRSASGEKPEERAKEDFEDFDEPEVVSTIEGEMRKQQDPLDYPAQYEEPMWYYPIKPAFKSESDEEEEDDNLDKMGIMSTCCCCFNTKNGTIAIGIICLIVAFCASVSFCFGLINVDEVQYELNEAYIIYQEMVADNRTSNSLQLLDSVFGIQNIINNIKTILIVTFTFYCVYAFCCLFLTYGACSDVRCLLMPWIVLEFIPFAIQLTIIVITFVFGKEDPVLSIAGVFVIVGLAQIVGFVIHVYWWMCAVAHYQSLKVETTVEALVPPGHPLYPGNLQKY